MLEVCGRYVLLPEGIQQEFPFSRALSGVLPPMEEEAESWESVMFPSSTPRPCRHTDGGQVPHNLQLPLLTSTLAGL